MHKDRWFDLPLHDNAELVELLGEPLVCREAIHRWPGSCIQLVITASRKIYIYKSRRGGECAARFNEAVSNPLVPKARTVHESDGCVCMLREYISKDRKTAEIEGEEASLTFINGVIDAVASMGDGFPTSSDWRGGSARWFAEVEQSVAKLGHTIEAYGYMETEKKALPKILECGLGKAMGEFFERPCIYAHGDLQRKHIIQTSDGIRLIDWYSPGWWPREMELANALRKWGFDPFRYVDPPAVFADYFKEACYCANSQDMYSKYCWYDHDMAGLFEKMLEAARRIS